jgi:hypothetical protein
MLYFPEKYGALRMDALRRLQKGAGHSSRRRDGFQDFRSDRRGIGKMDSGARKYCVLGEISGLEKLSY